MEAVLADPVFTTSSRRRMSARWTYKTLRRCGEIAFSLLVFMISTDPAFAATRSPEVQSEIGTSGGPGGPAEYLLRFYQKNISDLRYGRCRFEPSCSQYAIDAIQAEG